MKEPLLALLFGLALVDGAMFLALWENINLLYFGAIFFGGCYMVFLAFQWTKEQAEIERYNRRKTDDS